MRFIAALAVVLMVAGCGETVDPGLLACEAAIKQGLKAPSSYSRVKVDGGGSVYTIEYDAVNSYNAPLRQAGTCFYDHTTKSARWVKRANTGD